MKQKQAIAEAHRRALKHNEPYVVIRDDSNGIRAPHQDYYAITENDYYEEYPDIDMNDCVYCTSES